jgi:hypothetical protein
MLVQTNSPRIARHNTVHVYTVEVARASSRLQGSGGIELAGAETRQGVWGSGSGAYFSEGIFIFRGNFPRTGLYETLEVAYVHETYDLGHTRGPTG